MSAALSIRLFAPDLEAIPPKDAYASDTLRQAFTTHLLPSLAGRAQSTIDEYEKSLDHWEELTDDPAVCNINDLVCEHFRTDGFQEGWSPATVNKWMRHLGAIINRIGPKHPRNRRGKGIITDVPWFEPLPEDEPDPVCLTESQINAIYHACRVAEWPSFDRAGCSAPDFWRAVIVLAVTYGPRRTDLFRIKRSQVNLEDGKIGFRAKKSKKWHQLPITPVVQAHLEAIWSDRENLLTISSSNHYLYRQFQEIQHAARVKRADGEYFGFQNLRQTCAGRCDDHIPGTASVILGHALAKKNVTNTSYLGRQLIAAASRCILTIKQPSSFLSILESSQSEPQYNTGSD